jgi:hypothetical protein
LWVGAEVRFGVMLTGEKLVDNVDFRDQLYDLEPEAIGGEMEGTGLYVACQDKKVDWILVKAICDWADGQKAKDKDARQQTAALNAATFVLHFLQFAPVNWENKRREAASYTKTLINTGPDSVISVNQMGGQIAHSITNVGLQPRTISKAMADVLISHLGKAPPEDFRLTCAGDPESMQLRDVLCEILRAGGWRRIRITTIQLSNVLQRGLIIYTAEPSAGIKILYQVLTAGGLAPQLVTGDDARKHLNRDKQYRQNDPDDMIEITVGVHI